MAVLSPVATSAFIKFLIALFALRCASFLVLPKPRESEAKLASIAMRVGLPVF